MKVVSITGMSHYQVPSGLVTYKSLEDTSWSGTRRDLLSVSSSNSLDYLLYFRRSAASAS